ncbi:DUF5359 family protein [Bacillaceae bacterium IKA-2]|jgi:hypothetical protein|nr:DUF5359 family protein [Bacillaceae bacterium IKA-2]
MDAFLKRVESILLKLAVIQFLFLIVAQALLYQSELSPYLSRTIFSEGVFRENLLHTLEILDHITSIWYYV